jgi:hypothetical protein
VDEPRPQPPASEAPRVNDGRSEAARREAAHANALDDENVVRERSLFDDADAVEDEDEDGSDESRAGDVESDDDDERHQR